MGDEINKTSLEKTWPWLMLGLDMVIGGTYIKLYSMKSIQKR